MVKSHTVYCSKYDLGFHYPKKPANNASTSRIISSLKSKYPLLPLGFPITLPYAHIRLASFFTSLQLLLPLRARLVLRLLNQTLGNSSRFLPAALTSPEPGLGCGSSETAVSRILLETLPGDVIA